MSALPYMPLYIADYLADAAHLSTEEHGAYLLLIMTYWQRGKPLPADPIKLARISRLSDERWAEVEQTLSEFFDVSEGEWRHGRIDVEIAKVRDKSLNAQKAGLASGKSRARAEAEPKTNDRSTPVEQTLNHTDTDTDTERKVLSETSSDPSTPKRKRADYPTDFEDFWRAYPTDQNMSKVETFKAWGKLDEADRKLAFEAVAPFRAWVAKQKDYRVLHAVRFLSQRRFDGFGGATSPTASPVAAPQGFYVTYGTDAGDAWDAYFKTTKGISAPRDARGGWWHKTEWPPEHHSEAA